MSELTKEKIEELKRLHSLASCDALGYAEFSFILDHLPALIGAAEENERLSSLTPWAIVYAGVIIGLFRSRNRAEQFAYLGNQDTPGAGVNVVPISSALAALSTQGDARGGGK